MRPLALPRDSARHDRSTSVTGCERSSVPLSVRSHARARRMPPVPLAVSLTLCTARPSSQCRRKARRLEPGPPATQDLGKSRKVTWKKLASVIITSRHPDPRYQSQVRCTRWPSLPTPLPPRRHCRSRAAADGMRAVPSHDHHRCAPLPRTHMPCCCCDVLCHRTVVCACCCCRLCRRIQPRSLAAAVHMPLRCLADAPCRTAIAAAPHARWVQSTHYC